MRAIWTGEIAFGLVAIPVKLYSATKDLTPQFNQLHKECGTRISMVRRCPKCERDLAWEEIGKGYEVSKGQYALFTKEELAAIEGDEGAGGVDIAEFIEAKDVDLQFIEKSYWVGPAGKTSRGYDLLRAVLEETGKVALAKVKIRTRTRLGILRPKGKLFSLDMMRFGDELVPGDELVVPEGKAPAPRELELARGLVAQLSAPFDPMKHPDAYRTAVQAAVDQKVEAQQVKFDESTEEMRAGGGGKLIDLAELLARSLQSAPAANEASEPAKESPAPKGESAPEQKPGPKKAASEKGEKKESRKRAASGEK